MNEYFKSKFDSNNCGFLPDDIKEGVADDFGMMSLLGIDNIEDHNKYLLVKSQVPHIIFDIFGKKLNDKTIQLITANVFKNRNNKPINTFLGLIEAIGLALKKMLPEDDKKFKLAYPQPVSISPFPKYDINKWVTTTHEIYSLIHKGYNSEQAKQSVIGNWDTKEKMDYENWLKFYKERVPEKYPKLAADSFISGLPISALKAHVPNPISNDSYSTKVPPGMPQEDLHNVKDTIEKQRSKLVGRLNSAEKLLSSMDGQLFAGDEQELMLKLLHDLKRRIQTANKKTVKSSLFEDHIYKTANHLMSQGFEEGANFFYKIAQLPDLDLEAPAGEGLPEIPPMGGSAGSSSGDKDATHDALKEFFEGLKDGVQVEEEDEKEEEPPALLPVQAPAPEAHPPPPAKTSEVIRIGNGSWVKSAQFVPAMPKTPFKSEVPFRTEPKKDIVVEDDSEAPPDDNTDDLIEAALRNVSVDDVIHRLEMLVSVYNQREISRQLAILDIMMDRIGLASFFPALGEAMSKALDSNQYIGSRLGDVLTQLKGSIKSPGTEDWMEVDRKVTPQSEEIKQRLTKQREAEQKRKEMRKNKDVASLNGGEVKQQLVNEEELQQPARIERSPKINVR